MNVQAVAPFNLYAPTLPGDTLQVVRWLAVCGARIEVGAPLLIMVSSQIEVLLPAPVAGTLGTLYVAAGQATSAGALLGQLHPLPTTVAVPHVSTPTARTIAHMLGVTLERIQGSGAGGRIMRADVLTAAAQQAATPPPDTAAPATLVPSVVYNNDPLPLVLTAMDMDMESALEYCRVHAADYARRGLQLDYIACICYAAATALFAHPHLNATWSDAGIRYHRAIQLTLCEQHEPVRTIAEARDLTLRGITRALGEKQSECPASLTLVAGTSWLNTPPVISGIALGFGPPRRQAVVLNNQLAIRSHILVCMRYDARLATHAQADAFLRTLRRCLAQNLI